MPTAADVLVPAGDVFDDRLRCARCLCIATFVRKTDHGVGVANVYILGFCTDRVEGNPDGSVQACGKDLIHLGLAVAIGIPKYANSIRATFGEKEVPVWGANNHTWLL